MARICVVGSLNLDTVYEVAALPGPGETVLASSAHTGPGGKGGNQAVAAARAGGAVQLVAAVGEDAAGVTLRAHLRANDVGVRGLVTLPVPSGSAVIVVDQAAENLIVVSPGANAHLSLDSRPLRDIVAGAEVVLLQLEIPVEAALVAARTARAAGATVMVNASPRCADPLLPELAGLTDVVVVNESESAGWPWPVPHRVVTRGAGGALWRSEAGEVQAEAPAVEAVDTSGAGDVFAGVLAAYWPEDPGLALRRACAAGALATLVPGAGDCAPTAEAIEDVLTRD
ncbi:ribokinase [Mycolicibacterium palauense]|uniref:ribokinase n=1 Tax=Mycolicibacterium palauense TaxID=2034511 RepID=UPI000BFEF1C9|nr:ribokinase [Mycolicibacterium palauense]